MIKKTIYIGNPCYLHTRDAQLIVEYKDEDKKAKQVAIEDIALLVVDDAQVTVSHGVVNALVSNNAAVLWCNEKHLPNGMVLPIEGSDTFTQKLRCQVNAGEALKKHLWKTTIEYKIANQSELLKRLGKPERELDRLVDHVKSGDPDNKEAQAAAIYWRSILYDFEVSRGRDEPAPNNLFNYGYAILRAVVARQLVSSGFLPALGIHHRNKYNSFCLADDIMEPYRPFVDDWVLQLIEDEGEAPEELEKHHKAHLLQIPVLDVRINKKDSPLMVAVQKTTASLMKCYEGKLRKPVYATFKKPS